MRNGPEFSWCTNLSQSSFFTVFTHASWLAKSDKTRSVRQLCSSAPSEGTLHSGALSVWHVSISSKTAIAAAWMPFQAPRLGAGWGEPPRFVMRRRAVVVGSCSKGRLHLDCGRI